MQAGNPPGARGGIWQQYGNNTADSTLQSGLVPSRSASSGDDRGSGTTNRLGAAPPRAIARPLPRVRPQLRPGPLPPPPRPRAPLAHPGSCLPRRGRASGPAPSATGHACCRCRAPAAARAATSPGPVRPGGSTHGRARKRRGGGRQRAVRADCRCALARGAAGRCGRRRPAAADVSLFGEFDQLTEGETRAYWKLSTDAVISPAVHLLACAGNGRHR